ncbi:hypothetical protein CRG98_005135 [Punica granatum]|uniref:Uncharacterized protein n=1 Tax=Punica granatum TaxID=22663 RepID=A0A2I0L1G1_PUNGR|nr:hypothetical protein CRG98_005135 [Punica granatum]
MDKFLFLVCGSEFRLVGAHMLVHDRIALEYPPSYMTNNVKRNRHYLFTTRRSKTAEINVMRAHRSRRSGPTGPAGLRKAEWSLRCPWDQLNSRVIVLPRFVHPDHNHPPFGYYLGRNGDSRLDPIPLSGRAHSVCVGALNPVIDGWGVRSRVNHFLWSQARPARK